MQGNDATAAESSAISGAELRAARLAGGLSLRAVADAYGSRRQNVAIVEGMARVGPARARRYLEALASATAALAEADA